MAKKLSEQLKNKTVVVLGQRRSGTSMVAGILYKLGVPMDADIRGDEMNPTGYFEDKEINGLSKWFMKSDWKDKIKYNLAYKFISSRNKKHENDGIWGFKEVEQIFTHKFFKPYIQNLYYIIVLRNPYDIAKSLFFWYGDKYKVSFQECICVALKNEVEIEKIIKEIDDSPIIFLSFENIRKLPEKNVDKIIEFIDIKPTVEQINNAKKHISKKQTTIYGKNLQ